MSEAELLEAFQRAGVELDAAALMDRVERLRRAFPLAPARLEGFVRHWADRAAADALRPELAHVEDLYVAYACSEGDAEALALLRREHLLRALSRVPTASPDARDELAQLVMTRILAAQAGERPRIAAYSGRGPLEHWLRAVALRLSSNLRRTAARHPEQPFGELLPELEANAVGMELGFLRAHNGPDVRAALQRALSALSAKERSLLRLHYVDGLSLNQVGAMYQVNKSTVSRWITRARDALLDQTRKELEATLGLPPGEADSVIRAMGSQLHLSLDRLLRSAVEP